MEFTYSYIEHVPHPYPYPHCFGIFSEVIMTSQELGCVEVQPTECFRVPWDYFSDKVKCSPFL